MKKIKAICIGYSGTESVMQREIKEKLGADSKIGPSVAMFESDEKSICKLAYLGQSFTNILFLISSFKMKSLGDLKAAEKLDYSFLKDKTFKVNCIRLGEHEYTSQDIAFELGKMIGDKTGSKTDMKNQDIILLAYVFEGMCYLGIDIAGIDLAKRDYNVYPHRSSIKGPLAFALLMLAGYEKDDVLLDPFCLSGTVAIEAAYYSSGFPINYYRKKKLKFISMGIADEKFLEDIDAEHEKKKRKKGTVKKKTIFAFDIDLRSIRALQQNAKIGGVDKYIEFSRMDPDWMDVKLGKQSVDIIASSPPVISKWIVKNARKSYKEMFRQAEYVLKKNGKIAMIANKLLDEVASESGYTKEKSFKIQKKKDSAEVCIFKKGHP